MRTLTETVTAGQVTRLTATGRFFFLLEAIGQVSITFQSGTGGANDECNGLRAGFWAETPADLTQISLVSPIDQVITYACSNVRMGYSRSELQIEQASEIANLPAVTVGNTAAILVSAGDALKKGVAFLNAESNTDRIAIGGAGVTFANAVHIIAPGEEYADDNAAGAAFYAISESTAGQALRVEERR